MEPMALIPVDLILIARTLAALVWGIGWAVVLQHTRLGRFWAEERTWLTVVIGVGVDLALAFGGDWWACAAVVSASSVGVIARSLMNEARPKVPSGYKILWGLEDIIAETHEAVAILETAITTANGNGAQVVQLSRALALAHRANAVAKAARRGDYEAKGD